MLLLFVLFVAILYANMFVFAFRTIEPLKKFFWRTNQNSKETHIFASIVTAISAFLILLVKLDFNLYNLLSVKADVLDYFMIFVLYTLFVLIIIGILTLISYIFNLILEKLKIDA